MSKPEHSFITDRTVIRSQGVDPSVWPSAWYVLRHRTDPRAIALMLADMAAEGFDAYLPQLLVKRRVMRNRVLSSRKEWLSEPLFHGYLFARPNGKPARLGKSLTQVYAIEGCRPVGRAALCHHAEPLLHDRPDLRDVGRDGCNLRIQVKS